NDGSTTELIVALENETPAIVRFSLAGRALGLLSVPSPANDRANYRKKGRGLESVAVHSRYGVLTAPETPLEDQPDDLHTVYASRQYWTFTRRNGDSRLKGLAMLAQDSLLVLERTRDKSKPHNPMTASLRRVQLATCGGTRRCTPRTLALLPASADNFEGLAQIDTHTVLLVSDNGDGDRGTRFVLVHWPTPSS